MKEIGGYIELDTYSNNMLHENSVLLNCGRNALAYLIKLKRIQTMHLPYFLCDSVTQTCDKYGVKVYYYHVSLNWMPIDLDVKKGEWLYLVNFYGQLSNDMINNIVACYKNVIVDNAQAYFQKPIEGIDTLYSCRKFFGVADGAVLYTSSLLPYKLECDIFLIEWSIC